MLPIPKHIRANPEFQSALIRIAIWMFALLYIRARAMAGYDLDYLLYTWLFAVYLAVFLVIVLSIFYVPASNPRRYFSLTLDISASSMAIYLTGEAISPFYVLYIWIFVSYGSRYGRNHLRAASLISVVAFITVGVALDQFGEFAFELVFMNLFLVILPIYQNSLLQDLRDARTSAEVANHVRAKFLSTITRELRAPLSGMMAMSQLLRSTHLDDEQRGYLDSVDTSSHLMESAIGDVSDLARIERGQMTLQVTEFKLRDSLVEMLHSFDLVAREKEIDLLFRADADVPELALGDERRVRQALYQVLNNSMHLIQWGWVQLGVTLAGADQEIPFTHHCLTIRDTVTGLAQEQQASLFATSLHGDADKKQTQEYSSIGLSILHELVRLMGGYMQVDVVRNEGRTLCIHLPLMPGHGTGRRRLQASGVLQGRRVLALESNPLAADALKAACDQANMSCTLVSDAKAFISGIRNAGEAFNVLLISDTPRGEDIVGIAMQARIYLENQVTVVYLHYPHRPVRPSDRHEVLLQKPWGCQQLWQAIMTGMGIEPGQSAAAQPLLFNQGGSGQQQGPQGFRVLIAEDDRVNALLIESLLEKAGHEVVIAQDGEAALQAALEEDFDLALVDLHMPDLDGASFTRAYRDQTSGREGRLPIVALTSDDSDSARRESMSAGMDAFLTTPVNANALGQVMREQLL